MMDYKVTIKIQNNYMFSAMKGKGIETAAELSRMTGVSQSNIGKYLNMKLTPFYKDGSYSKDILKISSFLNVMINDLFPEDQLYNSLDKNTASFEMEKSQVEQLIYHREPENLLEDIELSDAIGYVLNGLTAREQKVIKMRFGIDGKEMTLKEVANTYDVTIERIRQIEQKALRKMRHPKRAAVLKMQDNSKQMLNEYLENR